MSTAVTLVSKKSNDSGHLTGHHVLLQLGHDRIAAVTKEDGVPAANNDCAQSLDEYWICSKHYINTQKLYLRFADGSLDNTTPVDEKGSKPWQIVEISEIRETYHGDEN